MGCVCATRVNGINVPVRSTGFDHRRKSIAHPAQHPSPTIAATGAGATVDFNYAAPHTLIRDDERGI
jgi:hypothetical protein